MHVRLAYHSNKSYTADPLEYQTRENSDVNIVVLSVASMLSSVLSFHYAIVMLWCSSLMTFFLSMEGGIERCLVTRMTADPIWISVLLYMS